MQRTVDLPICVPGELPLVLPEPKPVVPTPPARGFLARSRQTTFDVRSGVLNESVQYIMPGALVAMAADGAVGAPCLLGDQVIGHFMSGPDDKGYCRVLLNSTVRGLADTPLEEWAPAGRYQLSLTPVLNYR